MKNKKFSKAIYFTKTDAPKYISFTRQQFKIIVKIYVYLSQIHKKIIIISYNDIIIL